MIYLTMTKIKGTREYGDVAVNASNMSEAKRFVIQEVVKVVKEHPSGIPLRPEHVMVTSIERYGEGKLYDREAYDDEFWSMFKNLQTGEALVWDWGT